MLRCTAEFRADDLPRPPPRREPWILEFDVPPQPGEQIMRAVRRILVLLLPLAASIALRQSAWGEVRVAGLFGSHMVLPREQVLPVWGWAEAGETIEIEFAGQKRTATAADDGAWRVDLEPLSASAEPRSMKVTGSKTDRPLLFDDLLVGEVWLASGQSNMATSAGPEAAEADTPLVRFTAVDSYYPGRPAADVKQACRWRAAGRDSAPSCSGTALWFARRVQAELDVPVGVVVGAAGGSRAEHWTRREVLERTSGPDAYVKKILAEAERLRGKPPAEADRNKLPQFIPGTPEWVDARLGGRYNGMIAPLAPFPFRGVLWYQGEDNAGDFDAYESLLTAMIADWRATWRRELPFLIVQLPAYLRQRRADGTDWAAMREVQERIACNVPRCGLAVTFDNNDPDQLHPRNKRTVGTRLADVALRTVYNRDSVPHSPEFAAMTVDGGRATLRFRNLGEGLDTRDAKTLTGFQIAGADRRFVAAEAQLVANQVIVSSIEVAQPVAVRYAWTDAPAVSLFDRRGVPIAPFRTDDWKP